MCRIPDYTTLRYLLHSPGAARYRATQPMQDKIAPPGDYYFADLFVENCVYTKYQGRARLLALMGGGVQECTSVVAKGHQVIGGSGKCSLWKVSKVKWYMVHSGDIYSETEAPHQLPPMLHCNLLKTLRAGGDEGAACRVCLQSLFFNCMGRLCGCTWKLRNVSCSVAMSKLTSGCMVLIRRQLNQRSRVQLVTGSVWPVSKPIDSAVQPRSLV